MRLLRKAMLTCIATTLTLTLVNPIVSYAQEVNKNQSIQDYMESYTNELLSDMTKYNLDDGKDFSESFNSTKTVVNAYEAIAIKYKLNANGDNVEIRSTVSANPNYNQGVKISIDKGNGQFIFGNGARMVINDHLFVFQTNMSNIDTNNYVTNTQSNEIILLDTNTKKAYSLTSTLYKVEDNSDSDIPVKVTTKVFTYTGSLQDNDYASLYVASKNGKFKETIFNVSRKEFTSTYYKILYGFNVQPIFINMDVNRPYIYAYEVLAQIVQPNWEFHSKTPFYRHFEDSQFDSTSPITEQQIKDLQAPFTPNTKSSLNEETIIVDTKGNPVKL